MNYPVWDVAFGAGLLIAIVAILHVFVSHFAVGGGLFLVLTERKARRKNDAALLGWLKAHTKFFVLVTVVFGAISGVGIWFTIGLISPTATSNLIHIYVWGWAIEWVFFFIEITAALLYLYGWDKLEPRLHMWYGWIYFIAAYLSLVIINGIITFMLTSGSWIENHQFWRGFFNPTYFPSLAFRTAIALALAGIYALDHRQRAEGRRAEGAHRAMERAVDCALSGRSALCWGGGTSAGFPPTCGPAPAVRCPPPRISPCSPSFCLP